MTLFPGPEGVTVSGDMCTGLVWTEHEQEVMLTQCSPSVCRLSGGAAVGAAPSPSLLGCSFEEIGEREFTTLAKWLPTNRQGTGRKVMSLALEPFLQLASTIGNLFKYPSTIAL